MKSIFDEVSRKCSEITTRRYSTSFSLGILFLNKNLRIPIYSIYGFVRFADEIVDSFIDYDRQMLLDKFRRDTYEALSERISLNPVLNSFQEVVNKYGIKREWVDKFFESMSLDLKKICYDEDNYKKYILGSAEVVGLMCLHVFTEGNQKLFEQLKPYAMKLGSAFQKINFLRDVKKDTEELDREYFPGIDMTNFTDKDKLKIEKEIEEEISYAIIGIRLLPKSSRKGVYLAYCY